MNSQAEWLGFELNDAQLLVLLEVCGIKALPGVRPLLPDEQTMDHAWRELAKEGMIWNAAGSIKAHYLLTGILHTAADAKRVLGLRALGGTFTIYGNEGNFVCLLRRRGGACMVIPVRTKDDAWHLVSSFAKVVDGHAAAQIDGKSVGRLGVGWKARLEDIWTAAFDEARQNNK